MFSCDENSFIEHNVCKKARGFSTSVRLAAGAARNACHFRTISGPCFGAIRSALDNLILQLMSRIIISSHQSLHYIVCCLTESIDFPWHDEFFQFHPSYLLLPCLVFSRKIGLLNISPSFHT